MYQRMFTKNSSLWHIYWLKVSTILLMYTLSNVPVPNRNQSFLCFLSGQCVTFLMTSFLLSYLWTAVEADSWRPNVPGMHQYLYPSLYVSVPINKRVTINNLVKQTAYMVITPLNLRNIRKIRKTIQETRKIRNMILQWAKPFQKLPHWEKLIHLRLSICNPPSHHQRSTPKILWNQYRWLQWKIIHSKIYPTAVE